MAERDPIITGQQLHSLSAVWLGKLILSQFLKKFSNVQYKHVIYYYWIYSL